MTLGRQFHGARTGWVDTHVRPPSVTGVPALSSSGYSSGHDRPPHTELAFATNNESSAWSYARVVPLGPDHPVNNDPDPKHRSRLHEVGRAPDQHGDGGEIESQVGYPILRTHHSAPDVTSTFHEVNWNAYKAKPKSPHSLVSSSDANHSYMETPPVPHGTPEKPAFVPPYREAPPGDYQNRAAVDPRHPDQLNLYSGRTVAEHKQYENTPGISQHLSPGQFENVAFHRDPTTSTIRAVKGYHPIDTEYGVVHG